MPVTELNEAASKDASWWIRATGSYICTIQVATLKDKCPHSMKRDRLQMILPFRESFS